MTPGARGGGGRPPPIEGRGAALAPEPRGAVVGKALLSGFAVILFLWPLATPAGLAAGLLGTGAAYLLAHRLTRQGVRLAAGVAVGLATVAAGQLLAGLLLEVASGLAPPTALGLADLLSLGLGALGAFFALRVLSARLRAFSVLELAVVVGSVAHAFVEHRHGRIHQPRFLSDWAWSRGLEPETMLAAAGVAAVVLAALLLLRSRRPAQALAMLALLLLLLGLAAFLLAGTPRFDTSVDTNGLALTSSEKPPPKDQQGGGGKPPDPVAVALLHDDLPDAEVLYFRQAVRSRLVGDRLVEDGSGQFDLDVPTAFPAGAPVRVATPQAPAFHRRLRTSMYLLVDHAQLFGLGFPTELAPLENPNPRRFVTAYDVESLVTLRPIERLVGRQALPDGWSEAERRHYTELPADPRYAALSDALVREVDPRFVGDDVVKALAIKRYLETRGFYSLAQKQLDGEDPVGRFLFGGLRGYCVHFAHAAVFLLRSQGIPARVALGYGVQTSHRGAGSAVLIFANEAHAWPELYLDGVGWVTFDIYPEQSDEPPSQRVDQDLESALGELARKDASGGHSADPAGPVRVPWAALGAALPGLALALLVLAWAVKAARRLGRRAPPLVYRAVLDRLADVGLTRDFGESRERHAARVAAVAPSFVALTAAHLRLALGADDPQGRARLAALARQTAAELHRNLPWPARARGFLNPIGWWFTR